MNRILHVITTIQRGGAENHLVDLIKMQVNSGDYIVEVAYLIGSAYWLQELTKIGVKVHDLRMRFYGDPVPIFKLKSLTNSFDPDLVHAHLAPGEIYARMATMGNVRYKMIVSRHNEYTFTRSKFEGILGKIVASKIDGCICISNSVLKSYRNIDYYKSVPFWKVHYGREYLGNGGQAVRNAKKNTYGSGDKSHTILVNSRLIPQKRVDIAIRSFSEFLALGSYDNWQLKILGVGVLDLSLKELVRDLGLSGRVLFTGFVDNIDEINNDSDIFLHTPNKEGFGLVLLEAMNAALPIVSTNVSAIPEVVEDGLTGYLHKVEDCKGIATSLRRLADSEELRAELGRNGQDRLVSYFNLSRQHSETCAVYNKVLENIF